MEICTLASGSSGNCTLVRCGGTQVLIDAGISARRITAGLRTLELSPGDLDAILVTHAHTDHIAGLKTLTKGRDIPVYATAQAGAEVLERVPTLEPLLRPLKAGTGIEIGALWCQSFATPHDAGGSVGYSLSGDGCRMAVCTDLGHLTPEVEAGVYGSDLILAETNHDEDWVRTGPYPYYLKQRILGDYGHLSNELGAELIRRAVERGARTVLLGHLSAENNTPARARAVTVRRLQAAGIDPERDIQLEVAPRDGCGTLYRLERGQDAVRLEQKEAAVC